jgi:phenylalanyl-tRNA synthetase beta chain
MKISFNWLKDHLPVHVEIEDASRILTDTGLEVEGVSTYESIPGSLEGLVVGKVMHVEKHPDADRLNLTRVDVGAEALLDIVCGAPNVAEGQTVAVAMVGAELHPSEGEPFTIKKSKIRGAVSEGMLCAEDELGLGKSHDGIMVLKDSWAIGTPLAEVFSVYKDKVIEIGLTPNRMDAISHRGVARDLVAYLNLGEEVKMKSLDLKAPQGSGGKIKVLVLDKDSCTRYSGIELKGIKVGPSPAWLADRLSAIGLSPINNVVDITNYVMHDLGQPLHAFDADKIKGERIHVRKAVKGENFITLDDQKRELHDEDLMICDEKDPMCIAGVFGGKSSGVSELTTRVFLESAIFDTVSVRKTAKRHQLNTDSSFRFERGVDPAGTLIALAKAVQLLTEICGAEISSELVDIYPTPVAPLGLDLNLEKAQALIGVTIPEERISKILESLDFIISEKNSNVWKLKVPTYRMDVTRQADVVEEILRIHGFNQVPLPGRISYSMTNHSQKNYESIRADVSKLLNGEGYTEIMNNSLSALKYQELLPENEKGAGVRMLNPLSQDLGVMRQRMLWGAMENVAYNVNRQAADLRFFEFGKTYSKSEKGYLEKSCLALTLTGARYAENWDRLRDKTSLYDLRAVVQELIIRAGLQGEMKEGVLDSTLLDDGIVFEVRGKELARIGKVNSKTMKAFDVKQEVFHVEIDWHLLCTFSDSKSFKLQEIPKFPAVRRDLSLLLDTNVRFAEIKDVAQRSGGKLLKEVLLFDVYEGKNLPAGKVSYAIGFIIQDETSTLTDKVVEKIMHKVQANLEKEFKAELRQ